MHNLVFFIASIFILWIGRSIFIPLLVATFLWYLLNAIAAYYRRIMPCYKSVSCNIYLKKVTLENINEDLLNIYDEKLAEYAEIINQYRNEFINKLKEKIKDIHNSVTQEKEIL